MNRTQLLDPEVFRAMAAVSAAAKKGLGDPGLAELVMIRASQINHCAFCLDMHLGLARKHGESEDRIHFLGAWEETEDLYSERERAALALTEAVTVLTGGTSRTKSGGGFVPDEVYEAAAKHFDEAALAHLIALITVINGWNRLMVSRRVPPGGRQP
ncbi:carboxymuconolactone decarboxylase family protein [Streptomyces lavenduligriseus]|uniref:Carboxymuconolactone decarboxylase family protein n=1 Tax=Streptomyces lavenduligriseus TaxID=67315 RepID=A0ABT0NUQ4_9ACTN|nr:carboxymuconolactone decarboxylase family protein [Streptomyces lavenduligriseus]MCL3995187.1 carboxymuconolactone decarboxylase family protein [Streptomyces lavenduligriseus]